jgi:hypothetical protein
MSIALSLGNNLTTGGIFKPTAINNTSCDNVTSFSGITGGGGLVLLSTQTASASANISFTTGIDSAYDEYVFKFINIHPSANADFKFQVSTDGGSTYATTVTSTVFDAYQDEAGTATALEYRTGADLAQDSAFQPLSAYQLGSEDDSCLSGSMTLFNPSSTTYVKHFIANTQIVNGTGSVYTINSFVAGYFNTTSAVNAIRFQMTSGNIDDGIIKMYGVAKS